MGYTKLFYIITLVLFVQVVSTAQQFVLSFKHLNYKDGLSDNRVTDIIQARNGLIWMGNQVAIDRYDGEKVTSYSLGQGNPVNQLMEDDKERIWVTARKGLYRFNTTSDSFNKISVNSKQYKSFFKQNINAFIQAKNKWFYIATETGYLIKFRCDETGKVKENTLTMVFQYRNASDYFTTLEEDTDGSIWVGTGRGLVHKLGEKSIEKTVLEETSGGSDIRDLAFDNQHNLWVATNGDGLYEINIISGNKQQHTSGEKVGRIINNNVVLSLLVVDTNLWVGTDGGGLTLIDLRPKKSTHYLQKPGLYSISDNSIIAIKKGLGNTLFLATVHGGVSMFKNAFAVQTIPPEQLGFPLMDQQGSVILEDYAGNIWISAGRQGLLRYNPATGSSKRYLNDAKVSGGLNGSIVLSLFEDAQHRLWIGTFREGLIVLDLKTDRFIPVKLPRPINSVFSINVDKEGDIWVGHRTGILVFDSKLKIKTELHPASATNLSSNGVNAIYKDVKNDMWVGTLNGLYKYAATEKGLVKHSYLHSEKNPGSISGNHVLSIGESSDLSILVGTYGHGVTVLDRKSDSFSPVSTKSTATKTTYGILTDHSGTTWFSTNSGLTKMLKDNGYVNFEEKSGVYPFNGGAAFIDKRGRILMAGNYGFSYFYPDNLKATPPNFRINFTSATAQSKAETDAFSFVQLAVAQDNENERLTLDADNAVFSVNFACSDPITADEVTYVYKIKGISESWRTIGKQQSIFFSSLKPRDYTLSVKAFDANNQPNPHVAVIKFTVRPNLWQSTWFQLLALLLIASLVIKAYQWRISKLKGQREKLRDLLDQRGLEVKEQQTKIMQSEIDVLQIEKENQGLVQKSLKDELNFKTKELTNVTLRTVHKNDLLGEVKAYLQHEVKSKDLNKDNLKKLISHIEDSFMLDKDWDHFYSLFNQIHPSFIARIKQQNAKLSERDLKLAALIMMDFTSQNIATLFGISLSSVKVSRHRLRKKLEISNKSSISNFLKELAGEFDKKRVDS